MESVSRKKINVQATVNASPEKVWQLWTSPEHITRWNTASPDWHTPRAENDLRPGGRFSARMEAKDGSFGFDFAGTYDEVRPQQFISYTMDDERRVEISFVQQGNKTEIREIFDAEEENSAELQRAGWQAIMDNFKRYAEAQG